MDPPSASAMMNNTSSSSLSSGHHMDMVPPPSSPPHPPYSLAEIWQQFPPLLRRPPHFPHFSSPHHTPPLNPHQLLGGGLGNNNINTHNNHNNINININNNNTNNNNTNNNNTTNKKKKRELEDDSAKVVSSTNHAANAILNNDGDGKRLKGLGGNSRNEGHDGKVEGEGSSGKPAEQSINNKPPPDPPKQDYIHVRARRGQATDSHSLAERARREKISERMKILQDLVPGCNKVIGKALVLDEIINYIQSLQRQVEFLSMKLEAVNTRLNSGIEAFPPKDFGQQTFDPASMPFGSQTTREYSRGSSPEWLHMQVGSGFERTT